MKTKKKEDFMAIAEDLNVLRMESRGKVLTIPELNALLRGIMSTCDLARSWLVKAKIIVRVGHGKYRFPQEPIHWSCVENYFQLGRNHSRKKSTEKELKREIARPVQKIQTKPAIESAPAPEYSEEKAVAFLKNRGYIILKMM